MFQVIGDEVWFQGYAVATLRNDVPPSKRAEVVEILHGVEAEPDFCAECDAKDDRIGDVERERDDAREQRETAESRLQDIADILEGDVVAPEDALGLLASIEEVLDDGDAA